MKNLCYTVFVLLSGNVLVFIIGVQVAQKMIFSLFGTKNYFLVAKYAHLL